MRLIIDRNAFLKSLSQLQHVVERRNTVPILSHVKIDAAFEAMSLTATDLELEAAQTVAADVIEPGSTTTPAHILFEIVRKLPDGAQVELSFATEDEQLVLSSGRSRFMLPQLPVNDFPTTANSEDYSHTFTVSGDEMRSLIDRSRFAVSMEETRYYLNGVCFHATQDDDLPVLRAVATNGHVLARAQCPLPEQAIGMPKVIVPRKAIAEVRKLVEERTLDVSIAISQSKIRFSLKNAVLTSKLIDGVFPDYQSVIPQNNDKPMTVNKQLFADAVGRVSVLSSEKSRAVKVVLDKGSAVLSASSPSSGSAEEAIECSYDSSPLELGFNSRYMLDIMAQVSGSDAHFLLADRNSPILIRSIEDLSAVYVLMPMRV